ncbi:MAG: hypothetical protein HOW73_38285 [Polyangiaceae bacterium]|nr:hypothetical protein [Polyangiaceae bacterium]
MVELFKEGGWGMWSILVFGLIMVGSAGRFAARPDRRQLPFLGAMALTTVVSILEATWMALGAVFKALSDEQRIPDAVLTRTMWEGFKECTRPGAFGGGLLTIACLFLAVGLLRMTPRASSPSTKPVL